MTGPGCVFPAWVPCVCGDFVCSLHRLHAHDCPCPALEEWPEGVDPYLGGGRALPAAVAALLGCPG